MPSTFDQYADSVNQAIAAADAYYNGDTELLTDAEYDLLLESIKSYETVNPEHVIEHLLFTAVAGGTSKGGDVSHSFPMLSMEKTKEIEDLEKFIASIEGDIVVEPKLDGLALSVLYENGKLVRVALRGDGLKGEDVTKQALALKPNFLPLTVSRTDIFEVRGELIMDDEDFKFSSEQRMEWLRTKNNKRPVNKRKTEEELAESGFKNPRNAIAGSIRREKADYEVRATFFAYDLALADHTGDMASHRYRVSTLGALGFVASMTLADDLLGNGELLKRVEKFGELRELEEVPYPTDGIVLKADHDDDRKRVGETSSRPRWSMAFKYPDLRKRTILRAIEMAVGRTGNISFTAIFDPKKVEGSTIGRATLHNFDYIQEHDLRIGGTYFASKRNGVIPRIEKIEDHVQPEELAPYAPERVCPVSGEPLDTSGAIWRSTSPEASLGSLIEYASSRAAFDIEGIGSGIAIELVEAGLVNSVADIFTLTEDQIAGLPLIDGKTGEHKIVKKTGELQRVGETQAKKIIAEIEKAKSVPFNRVITSLGIRKCGRTFGIRLAKKFATAENLIAATMDDLMEVEGVKEGRGEYFFSGIAANAENLRRMGELGVNMGVEKEEAPEDAAPLPLAGMKVCITGALKSEPRLAHIGRDEANELIESYGGTASSGVSASTSFLVAGENSEGTSKYKNAIKFGKRIITPKDFADLLGITG